MASFDHQSFCMRRDGDGKGGGRDDGGRGGVGDSCGDPY